MFVPHTTPFLLLPARFLLFGLLTYVGLEMLVALTLENLPQFFAYQQAIVLVMRLLELLVFIGLIHYYALQKSLGLCLPTYPQLRAFILIGFCCVFGAGILYVIQPVWFAYIGIPSWIHGFAGLFLMILLAPVVEELIFRGLLYRMLREQWNITISVTVSAVFFSLLHQGQLVSPQLVGGIIFALAYEWSKSLWVAIGLHIGANSAVYVLSLYAMKG